ncbi:Cro/Cl family transcriptional regulator [Entomomonas moraniae]|uniref:Cro/Cl family transcriptional regulator n=1 Tax=Entomomonas moraniae TaxID=2213226 RepID=A0A3Q9JJ33_9GAMM|nr:Cro/CI family transcriptional regulator [Entomomonas moraniae]AZS50674.1 Cro/Cl family transcriptional regulator [Entomomonas moraniae]
MKEIPLKDYLDNGLGSQVKIAEGLGVNQSAVSLMYRKDRNIILFIDEENNVLRAEERRPVPSKKIEAA